MIANIEDSDNQNACIHAYFKAWASHEEQASSAVECNTESSVPAALAWPVQNVAARKLLYREMEEIEFIPIICKGWAACAIALPNGSRQILSLLLPGDIVSMTLVFEPAAPFLSRR